MPAFRLNPGHSVLVAVLLSANAMMYAAWPFLSELPFRGNSMDAPVASRTGRIRVTALTRNPAYFRAFCGMLRSEESILFLGTSESHYRDNLAAQLNAMPSEYPVMYPVAVAGLSPIHMCVTLACCEKQKIVLPPVIVVVNLVYFTQSHDAINDGWLGNAIPPVLLQMDHDHIVESLGDDVRHAYARHFALRRALFPAAVQTYVGNLIYLRAHQPDEEALCGAEIRPSAYRFDGKVPCYDEHRGVPVGHTEPDRLAKGRWLVRPAQASVNVKGFAAMMRILHDQRAPRLVIVLPMNRRYYAASGLDMGRFDNSFSEIRKCIRKYALGGNAHFIDLYDSPEMDMGFRDRMHLDAYGNYQAAKHVLACEEYGRFMEAVREYYASPRHKAEIAQR